jgi:flagellar L-ring protein precursor FlgH
LTRGAARADARLARPIARKPNDRITIVINEATSSSLQSKTDGKSSADVNMGLESWFTMGLNGPTSRGGDGKLRLPFKASSSRSHKGDSKSQDTQSFQTELSGWVLDVLPNGHLVVEARKTLTVNKDTRTVIVTGRVDPANLDANSRVDAKFVMDADVKFLSKGDMANDNKRGWITRLYDRVKPL